MRTVALVTILAIALFAPALAVATCVPTCDVRTVDVVARWAYVPAVTVVASGSSVAWSALDSDPHTATDRAGFCFNVAFAGPSVKSVRFTIVDGLLHAAVGAQAPEACVTAVALAEGAFALPYECLVHPRAMEGLVVVHPEVI